MSRSATTASRPATVAAGSARIGPGTLTVVARLDPGDEGADSGATVAAARAARAGGALALLVPAPADPAGYPALLAACAHATGLPVIADAASADAVAAVAPAAAMLRVRTGQLDAAMTAALDAAGLPVLLERGPDADVTGWLEAAGRLGPDVVALCDRGEHGVVDLTLVPRVRAVSTLPVLVDATSTDPAATGALARAATAAGADGVLVTTPEDEGGLAGLVADLSDVAGLHGRRVTGSRIRYVRGRWADGDGR
jgi:mRNA-degrading endonuclease toxin of MazEF toxin-antitoxin module